MGNCGGGHVSGPAFRPFRASAIVFIGTSICFLRFITLFLSASLSAETREIIYMVVCCTVASVLGLFDVRLISELSGSRCLRRGICGLLCTPVITLPLVIWGHTQTALQFGSSIVAIQMLAMATFAFSARADATMPFGRTLTVV